MTGLDIFQMVLSLAFLVATCFQLIEARNCRKARKQYQAMVSIMTAKEDGVPFQ